MTTKQGASDYCKACGSADLFDGFFDRNGLAVNGLDVDGNSRAKGVRYTSVCQQCGQFQDKRVSGHRYLDSN